MKSQLALTAFFSFFASRLANACSTQSGVTITFYGYPDNTPPGPATAYNCGGRNNIAGGIGTYSNPLTFASAPGEFNTCEIIYVPYLRKYARFEDTCDTCTTDWRSGKYHIDIWTGSSTVNGGQNQINCENDLTPNAQNFVRAPPTDLTVDSTALYANGQCATSHTYNNAPASCSGSTCSWAGHCLGA
ncbi:MAG: hypothetical protein Q9190_000211 [Brigantiaea leucoxantha]